MLPDLSSPDNTAVWAVCKQGSGTGWWPAGSAGLCDCAWPPLLGPLYLEQAQRHEVHELA